MTKEQDQKIVAAKQALVSMIGNYIGRNQASVVADGLRTEEALDIAERILEVWDAIKTMPQTYDSDGMSASEVMCKLHYFHPRHDFGIWVTEKDRGSEGEWTPVTPQSQAYGLVDLGEPETGYIDLNDALNNGFNLDLYWTPKSLKAIQTERRNRGYN